MRKRLSLRKRWQVFAALLLTLGVFCTVWQFRYDGADPRVILWPPPPEPAPLAALDEIVPLDVDEQPLREVLADLGERYVFAVQIDDAALKNLGITSNSQVTLHAERLTLRTLLNLLVRQADYRLVVVEHRNGILVTTGDKWRSMPGHYVTRTYRLDALLPHSASRIDEAAVAEIAERIIPPNYWKWNSQWSPNTGVGLGDLDVVPGAIVVQQLPEAHRRIEDLLDALSRVQRDRDRREPLVVGLNGAQLAARQRVLRALDRPTSLDVINARLDEALTALAEQAGVPIHFDVGTFTAVGIGLDDPVTHSLQRVTLRSQLMLLLRNFDLTFVVRGGAIVVTTIEIAEQEAGTHLYPVADLVDTTLRPEQLLNIVTTTVAPDSWADVGGFGGAACLDGVLIVRQTEENHGAVEQVLAELRHALHPSQFPPPADRPVDVAARQIKNVLAESTSFDFHDTQLVVVADVIARRHHLNVVLDRRALDGVGIGPDAPVSFSPGAMPLESALRLLLRPLDLTFMIQDEALLITTPEEAEANLITRYRRVPHVLQQRLGSGWGDLVKGCVEPVSWADVGGPGEVGVYGDLCVISQTEEVHQEAQAFLAILEHAVEHCRDETSPVDVLAPPTDFERRTRAKLAESTSIDIVDEELGQVVQRLARRHDVPIVLDMRALDGVGVGAKTMVSLNVENVQLRTALNLLTRQLDLVFDIMNGAIRITTPEESEANLDGRIYPIAGLIHRRSDYSVEALAGVLMATTDHSWEDQGGPGSIDQVGGVLLIYTTLDNHQQIEQVLAALRKPYSDVLDSYPVGFEPDSAPMKQPIRFYPIADLQRRCLPAESSATPQLRCSLREWTEMIGFFGRPTWCWGPAPPPERSGATTFAERLTTALKVCGAPHGDEFVGGAVYGEVMCVSGPPACHQSIEQLLAQLREQLNDDAADAVRFRSAADEQGIAATHRPFLRLDDVRPCLRAFPELDVDQLRELMLRAAAPMRWRRPPLPFDRPGNRMTDIAALPSMLVVFADSEAQRDIDYLLSLLPSQADKFPRPADLFRDDNAAAIAALARRLREAEDPREAAWLAALAAMIEQPATKAAAEKLADALAARFVQARARGELDLQVSLCHAIVHLGEPRQATIDALLIALEEEPDAESRQWFADGLVALGAEGCAAAVRRLTSIAGAPDKIAESQAAVILHSLQRQGSHAKDEIPALLELLPGRHKPLVCDVLKVVDPRGEASRDYLRKKLADPRLRPGEKQHFTDLEREVEECFRLETYQSSGFF